MNETSVFTLPVQSPAEVVAMVRRNLRLVRLSRGLSSERVARELGMGKPTVAAHERGSRKVSMDTLHRYARFYGVTVADLFDPVLLVRLPRRTA